MFTTLLCNDQIKSRKEETTFFPEAISLMLPQGSGEDDEDDNNLSSYADTVCLKTPYKVNSRSNSTTSSATDDTNPLSVMSDSITSSSSCFLPPIPAGPQKSVRFDKVIIREYNITVGNNPACSAGAPITLSWEYNPITEQFPVDVYESYRDGQRCGPEDLKLNERFRHRLLLEWDVPISKIKRAERRCRLAQDQRRQTIECLIKEEEGRKSKSTAAAAAAVAASFGQPRLIRNIKETFSRIFASSSS